MNNKVKSKARTLDQEVPGSSLAGVICVVFLSKTFDTHGDSPPKSINGYWQTVRQPYAPSGMKRDVMTMMMTTMKLSGIPDVHV